MSAKGFAGVFRRRFEWATRLAPIVASIERWWGERRERERGVETNGWYGGTRGGKKSRVESEKRNRAEVRRTDSIVPWWNEERKRERPPFVGLPFPCLVGRTRTVRGTFLGKSVAAFWDANHHWEPVIIGRPRWLILQERKRETDRRIRSLGGERFYRFTRCCCTKLETKTTRSMQVV